MDIETPNVDEFAALENERATLETRLEAIQKRTAKLEQLIIDDWADRCVQKVTVAGRTVFIRSDFYCSKKKGVETAEICRQLKAEGLGSLVAPSYSATALKSRVKEWFDEDANADADAESVVPKALQKLLNYDKTPRLRSLKA